MKSPEGRSVCRIMYICKYAPLPESGFESIMALKQYPQSGSFNILFASPAMELIAIIYFLPGTLASLHLYNFFDYTNNTLLCYNIQYQ
jgi:hypothetical protein